MKQKYFFKLTFFTALLLCCILKGAFAQKYVEVHIKPPKDNLCIYPKKDTSYFFPPSSVIVKPNPNNGKFYIEISNYKNDPVTDLYITNNMGIKIYSIKQEYLMNSKIQIDISNASAGLYIITINRKYGNISKKIIIK
jgi:hypothetical protein